MTDTSALYQEVILDHNRRPRNYSVLADATIEERGINPLCGDELTLYLRMDGDRIADASFQGSGCAISRASASMMTDAREGEDARRGGGAHRAVSRACHGEERPRATCRHRCAPSPESPGFRSA